MTTTAVNALIVTLAADGRQLADMPRCVVGALCAVNLLLTLENDMLERLPRKFGDFSVSSTTTSDGAAGGGGARISFLGGRELRSDIVIDAAALQHLKSVGSMRELRLCSPRPKL